MKRELSELLSEAKADPPPPRYGVDDAVAAGRKLQTRRRTAWAGAGSAAAVVAVAAAVAVPQMIPGKPAPESTAPAATTTKTTPSKQASGPVSYPGSNWDYAFKGYTVGQYQVGDPFLVTANYQQARIRIGDELEEVYEGDGIPLDPDNPKSPTNDKVAYSAPGASLLLTVYRPGKFNPKLLSGGTEVTVGGRPGLYKNPVYIDGDQDRRDDGHGTLGWQYADDAWAVIYTAKPNKTSRDDLVAIAEGLKGAAAYPATVAMKLAYLPSGYRLTSGGRGADWPNGAGEFQSTGMRFVKGDDAAPRRPTTPVIDPEDSKVQDLRLSLYTIDFSENRPPAGADGEAPYCKTSTICYRMAPGGKWQAELHGSGVSQEELKQVLAGLQFADVDDPSSWYPITSATP